MPVIPVSALINAGTTDFTTLQLGLIAQVERDALSPRESGLKLEEFWIGGLRKAAIEGNVDEGSMIAGQSVGQFDRILPVKEIIAMFIGQAVDEADRVLTLLKDT